LWPALLDEINPGHENVFFAASECLEKQNFFEHARAQVSMVMICAETRENIGFFGNLKKLNAAEYDRDFTAIDLCVRQGDRESIPDLLRRFFLRFIDGGLFYDSDMVKLRCISLADHIIETEEDYIKPEYPEQNILELKKNITSAPSLEMIYAGAKNLLMRLCDLVAETRTLNGKRLVRQTVRYIHEHYNKDIRLTLAAEKLRVSPSYLSRIFSSEMGETFSHYLLACRVEQAKKLLRDSGGKVYEISAEVGYEDVVHFSKVFKRFTGLSPGEYRNRL
jgi:AraC-like DNA-binding protein